MQKLENIIEALCKLKDLKRSGWLMKNVNNPESVADHSYGVALLSLLLAPEHLDKNKCLKLAIVHDLQECLVGDYTFRDKITQKEKFCLEQDAVKKLAESLNFPELIDLFAEYEARQTPESRFVKDIDRLEAVMQAKYYDDNQRSPNDCLSEFLAYAKTQISGDEEIIKEIFDGFN